MVDSSSSRQPAVTAPSAHQPAGAAHLAFVDGVRASAALFVAVCHSYFEPTSGYYSSWIMNHLGLSYGHIAVDIFIVVSGFCLMLPVLRRGGRLDSVASFMRRR